MTHTTNSACRISEMYVTRNSPRNSNIWHHIHPPSNSVSHDLPKTLSVRTDGVVSHIFLGKGVYTFVWPAFSFEPMPPQPSYTTTLPHQMSQRLHHVHHGDPEGGTLGRVPQIQPFHCGKHASFHGVVHIRAPGTLPARHLWVFLVTDTARLFPKQRGQTTAVPTPPRGSVCAGSSTSSHQPSPSRCWHWDAFQALLLRALPFSLRDAGESCQASASSHRLKTLSQTQCCFLLFIC